VALADAQSFPRTLARRRISPRALVGVAVAALGVAVLAVLYRGQQPKQVLVLRAAHDLPAGAVLTAADLQPVAEAIPDDVVATLVTADRQPDLLGQRTSVPLTGGEFLTRSQLGQTRRGIGASQRLITIPIDTDTAVGLNLARGDTVELAATGSEQAQSTSTNIVVPAATVYDVGPVDGAAGVLGTAQKNGASTSRQTWLSLVVDESQVPAVGQARSAGDVLVALVPEGQAP
jgi:hypothetical protein